MNSEVRVVRLRVDIVQKIIMKISLDCFINFLTLSFSFSFSFFFLI